MSVLKYFKNIPRSPFHRATGPKCNFFSSNLQRSPWTEKNPVARWRGDRGLSPSPRATAAGPSPRARQGGLSPPPRATGVTPLYKIQPPIPSSFESENSTKNPEKKRGVRRRKAAKPCRIQHL